MTGRGKPKAAQLAVIRRRTVLCSDRGTVPVGGRQWDVPLDEAEASAREGHLEILEVYPEGGEPTGHPRSQPEEELRPRRRRSAGHPAEGATGDDAPHARRTGADDAPPARPTPPRPSDRAAADPTTRAYERDHGSRGEG